MRKSNTYMLAGVIRRRAKNLSVNDSRLSRKSVESFANAFLNFVSIIPG